MYVDKADAESMAGQKGGTRRTAAGNPDEPAAPGDGCR